MADTAFLVLVILSMLLNLFVYTPILSYWVFKIVKYRHSFVIKKRLPTLLIAVIALSIVYFSIEKSIQLFTMGDIMNSSSKLLLNKIIFYIFQIPFIYFLWFYALRFWLLYYKLEWSLSMMNNEWKSIIHHNNASDDWFIIHRQQYGSLRYLQKKLIIAVSIITILCVLSWILYWEEVEPNGVFVWMIYIIFIFTPPTCILFYVAYKLPHYDDYLALKDELKYTCYGFIIVIFILILFFAIINSVQGLSSSPYLSLLLWHIIILWNFTMITLHTYWVVKRFDHVLRRTRYSDASLFSDINKVTTNKVKNNKPAKINKIHYKLQQILIHPKSYDLFMHHLWKEHSSECLLSSTEFIHYQYLIFYHHQAMHSNHNCMACDDCLENKDLHQLHPEIPQSSIVFGANPTSKISAYIMSKLNGPSSPYYTSYVHKKSIAFNQTLSNLTRNIANTISPSRSKAKNIMNGSGKPILAMSAPTINQKVHRKRHSLSGKLSLRNKAKSPKSKQKIPRKRRSLSSNKPVPIVQDNNGNKEANKHVKSHSAFQLQLQLNINTSDLLQGFEPKSPPLPVVITSNEQFYKKPKQPQKAPPALPVTLSKEKVVFEAMPSRSVDNTDNTSESNDNNTCTEPSLHSIVINDLQNNTYSGLPLVSGDTPTLKAHYIDPNEPPLPPLKPLPLPPDPNIDLDETVRNVHKKTISLRDRLNSLRHLRGNSYGLGHGHRNTNSSKIIFGGGDDDDDDESFCTSEEEKEGDSEAEDSVIMLYKSMDTDELDKKKLELIRKYREIAYELWRKYISVGAEYEINIGIVSGKMKTSHFLSTLIFYIVIRPCETRK